MLLFQEGQREFFSQVLFLLKETSFQKLKRERVIFSRKRHLKKIEKTRLNNVLAKYSGILKLDKQKPLPVEMNSFHSARTLSTWLTSNSWLTKKCDDAGNCLETNKQTKTVFSLPRTSAVPTNQAKQWACQGFIFKVCLIVPFQFNSISLSSKTCQTGKKKESSKIIQFLIHLAPIEETGQINSEVFLCYQPN